VLERTDPLVEITLYDEQTNSVDFPIALGEPASPRESPPVAASGDFNGANP
jgi:hypothetical protein